MGYLHGSGGAERQVVMLSNALAERGHEVNLIILAENKSKYSISKDVIIHDLSAKEGTSKLSILYRFFLYRQILLSLNPDVSIHYNLQSAYFTAAICSKKRGKIIYSERGDPYDSEYSGLLRLIRSWAVKRIDGFVFQSNGAKEFFSSKVQSRSIVIHNSVSVPPNRYPICEHRDKFIVSIGRLNPQKNQMLLIRAFAKIANSVSDYNLVIFGEGELYHQLIDLIGEFKLQNRVSINAPVENIYEKIRTASLFVLSSDFEGMPNALMEAMALGVPSLSTDCSPGGARDLIQNGVNGVIVPVKDADALAAKMLYMIEHKDESEVMAHNAMKILETHTPESVFNQWNQYIEKICCQ